LFSIIHVKKLCQEINNLTSVEINIIGYENQWAIMPYKPEQKAGAK